MDFIPLIAAAAVEAAGDAGAEPSKLLVIFDKFGLQWQVILAQSINFLVVAYVLWRFAIKPVLATVDERQARIAEGLQHAEEMKLRLEEAEKEKEETLREASIEAQRIVKEAQGQAMAAIDRSTEDARNQADQIMRRAEESIVAERKKVMDESRAEIARLVVATSRRVLNRDLSDEERKRFTESAGQELSRN